MDSFVDMMNMVAGNIWMYAVPFLVVLSLLVFVHEWGHYIVARMCGVKIDAFSIGFGKELFGWTDKRGTRWKFSLVPLGGYVKMFGDADPASAHHKDGVETADGEVRAFSANERSVAFFAKPVWQRALIVFAGPGINFLFAIIVLTFMYCYVGKPITPPIASAVEIGGAANLANIQPHDEILSIDGKKIVSFDDVRRTVMLALDTPLNFEVKRNDQIMNVTVTPKKMTEEDRFGFKHEKGYLGLIGPANGFDITKLKKINTTDVTGDATKAREMLIANMDKVIDLELDRGTETAVLRVKAPANLNTHLSDPDSKEYNALILGVRPGDALIQYNPATGLVQATIATWEIIRDTLKAIGQMITGTRSASELGGLIRIGAMTGDMAERGFIALATFTALLSINLGLINLFPIPMLDGGHLVFYAVEAIKGKPLSEKFQEYAFRVGLFLLVSLMLFANLNDVIHLIL